MLAIARAYFASEADARDAAQEAFLKAFQQLGRVVHNERFAGWLTTITANTCRDTLRRKSDKVSLAEYSSTAQFRPRLGQDQFTPATLSSKREDVERTKVAIGRLPESQRIVVMLRYMEHMTYERIAAYLDVPPSTVRGRLARAKDALRQSLRHADTPTP